MKRFILSILAVSVFCIGLGTLADRAGASFRSDEKALVLIQKARQAIGGDAAIASIQSMVIAGKTTRTLKIDGAERSVEGDTEIAMQLPNKIMKMMTIGDGNGQGQGMKMIDKQVNVVVTGDQKNNMDVTVDTDDNKNGAVKKIVIKKSDGTVQEFTGAEADKIAAADGVSGGDKAVKKIVIKRPDGSVQEFTGADADKFAAEHGDTFVVTKDSKTGNGADIVLRRTGGPAGDQHDSMKHNEMLRLTLGLLLSAPQGMDVSYTFGGEGSIDSTACNIVNAEFAGSTYKLYLGQTSNLPVALVYTGMKMPKMIMFKHDAGADAGAPKDASKDNVVFMRKVDAPPMETAEFTVKFTDFRSVSGVQLPFKWTQTVAGVPDEIFDVTSYDVNPANIGDRFDHDNVKVNVVKSAK